MGHFLRVSSGQCLALPGSEPVFGITQGSPLYVLTSLNAETYGKVDITYYGVVPPSLPHTPSLSTPV